VEFGYVLAPDAVKVRLDTRVGGRWLEQLLENVPPRRHLLPDRPASRVVATGGEPDGRDLSTIAAREANEALIGGESVSDARLA
jgi:hypothetical protein